jgi:hypothetical protein
MTPEELAGCPVTVQLSVAETALIALAALNVAAVEVPLLVQHEMLPPTPTVGAPRIGGLKRGKVKAVAPLVLTRQGSNAPQGDTRRNPLMVAPNRFKLPVVAFPVVRRRHRAEFKLHG